MGHFEHTFQGVGGHPPTNFGVSKTRVPWLSRVVVCVIQRLAVLIQYRRVTHRQTDTQTRDDGYYPLIACATWVITRTRFLRLRMPVPI